MDNINNIPWRHKSNEDDIQCLLFRATIVILLYSIDPNAVELLQHEMEKETKKFKSVFPTCIEFKQAR